MKLPVASGGEAIKAFERLGYEIDAQHGSHVILRRREPPHRRLSVRITSNRSNNSRSSS